MKSMSEGKKARALVCAKKTILTKAASSVDALHLAMRSAFAQSCHFAQTILVGSRHTCACMVTPLWRSQREILACARAPDAATTREQRQSDSNYITCASFKESTSC